MGRWVTPRLTRIWVSLSAKRCDGVCSRVYHYFRHWDSVQYIEFSYLGTIPAAILNKSYLPNHTDIFCILFGNGKQAHGRSHVLSHICRKDYEPKTGPKNMIDCCIDQILSWIHHNRQILIQLGKGDSISFTPEKLDMHHSAQVYFALLSASNCLTISSIWYFIIGWPRELVLLNLALSFCLATCIQEQLCCVHDLISSGKRKQAVYVIYTGIPHRHSQLPTLHPLAFFSAPLSTVCVPHRHTISSGWVHLDATCA